MKELELYSKQTDVQKNGNRKKRIAIIVVIILFAGMGYWLVTAYLFPASFSPVILNESEQKQLNQKLNQLGFRADNQTSATEKKVLEPEPYSEINAEREILFSEKEINAVLAYNTDLADKLAIDLADNLASAKLLVPLDQELPVFGGKTLKVTAGLEIRIEQHNPRVLLRGVSIWGVPVPNAWLGNIKNIDLIKEFGDAGGFWQAFTNGVEEVVIADGSLRVKLKE